MPLQIGDYLEDPGDPEVGIQEFMVKVVAKLDDKHFLANDDDFWVVIFTDALKDGPAIGDGGYYPKGWRVWAMDDDVWVPLAEIVEDWGRINT